MRGRDSLVAFNQVWRHGSRQQLRLRRNRCRGRLIRKRHRGHAVRCKHGCTARVVGAVPGVGDLSCRAGEVLHADFIDRSRKLFGPTRGVVFKESPVAHTQRCRAGIDRTKVRRDGSGSARCAVDIKRQLARGAIRHHRDVMPETIIEGGQVAVGHRIENFARHVRAPQPEAGVEARESRGAARRGSEPANERLRARIRRWASPEPRCPKKPRP